MSPVLTIVGKVGQAIISPKTGHPETHLWVEALESIALAVERHSGVKEFILADQLQTPQNGCSISSAGSFQTTQPNSVVQRDLDFLGIEVVDGNPFRNRFILPTPGGVESFHKSAFVFVARHEDSGRTMTEIGTAIEGIRPATSWRQSTKRPRLLFSD